MRRPRSQSLTIVTELVLSPGFSNLALLKLSDRTSIFFVTKILPTLLLIFIAQSVNGASVSYSPSIDTNRFDQRKQYLDAIHLVRTNQFTKLKKAKPNLRSYSLYPYLEYTEMVYRISRQSEKDILAFAEQKSDTPLVEPLVQHWLKSLAKRNQWQTFLTYYESLVNAGEIATTKDLDCHYGFALHKNGLIEKAFNQAQKLWLVGFSQPKACDPIFQLWRGSDRVTRELAWDRLALSLKENNKKLSNYLLRFIHKEDKTLANNYRLVHIKPRTIKRYKSFRQNSSKNREIIIHGAARLARTDPKTAFTALRHYESILTFRPDVLEKAYAKIGIHLANGSANDMLTDQLPVNLRNYPNLVEARIRQSLKRDDFSTALVLISLLPDEIRDTSRWQYWKARILGRSEDIADRKRAGEIFRELAIERSFYGFLAADVLGKPYNFEEEITPATQAQTISVEEMPGIQRALELFALGERSRARREWYFTTADFTVIERKAAASIALRWGWYKVAIQTMIDARAWNQLEYRFPIAHRDNFITHARRTNIPLEWSLAVARQESSFMTDARSSAGALGVMQLMPATARLVADSIGAKYKSKKELTQTDLNIRLGTNYLGQMLRRYDNNRILASAAYNAGPGRVDKWLDRGLPFDIWIESIPFKETRGYVQNVLMFSSIYARRINEVKPLIYEHERAYFADRRLAELPMAHPNNS